VHTRVRVAVGGGETKWVAKNGHGEIAIYT